MANPLSIVWRMAVCDGFPIKRHESKGFSFPMTNFRRYLGVFTET